MLYESRCSFMHKIALDAFSNDRIKAFKLIKFLFEWMDE